jgi:hypothetical protein
MELIFFYSLILLSFLFFAKYYITNIRGIHPVSKVVSKKIKVFLEDSTTYQVFKDRRCYKYFVNGHTEMEVWSTNWPYAYGSSGKIMRNNHIVFSWGNENPSYRVRRMIKNFDKTTHLSKRPL